LKTATVMTVRQKTVSPTDMEVQVGEGFLRTGHDYVSGRFHYDIDDKYLFIQPDNEEGSHFKNKARPFKISIDKMFDLNVFLTAITDLLGIR